MSGGGQVDVSDEEHQHHERTGSVDERHRFQAQVGIYAPALPVGVEKVEQARTPDDRREHRQQRQIRQALQRVVLLGCGFLERVGRIAENAEGVITHHGIHLLQRRNVLLPFAGGELPEDGEGPERQQCPGEDGVQVHRLFETEQLVCAMHFEAGDHHGDDEHGLRPVPETLIAFVEVDAVLCVHLCCPFFLLV